VRTLKRGAFSAKVLYVKGRSHKVDIKYLDAPTQDYIEATVKTVFQIHCMMPPGDILVFLAGQDDIEAVRSQLDLYLLSLPKDKLQVRI
jgi:HrpA-like RNA helicase